MAVDNEFEQAISPSTEPAWMANARRRLGVKEGPGAANNPVILGWAGEVGGWIKSYFTADSIAWCGLFVDVCLTEASCRTPGDKSLGALNWAAWGQALTKGQVGAVLVFKRLGGGHVGFYVAEDADCYHVLGGNQSDSVCIERILKSRCVAIRWPYESVPKGLQVMVANDGSKISTDEA